MRRPSAQINRSDEETSDCPSTMAPNSAQVNFEDYNSYLNDNSAGSDSECLSESSRKIRKKRNTYQKISDEIRLDLLDAVKNGETLKAAAKRHKINYSSAKSILHTFRKEGRILKKSAQERTMKKKSFDSIETESFKTTKSIKKEKMAKTNEFTTSLAAISEGTKSELASNDYSGESSPISSVNGLKSTFPNQMRIENYDHHVDHSKASTLASLSNQYGYQDNEEPKYNVDNNYYMNYFDAPATETSVDHMLNSGPSYANYSFLPNEFGCFGDFSAYHTRPYHNEQHAYTDPSNFLSQGFNASYIHEDRDLRMGGDMESDFHRGSFGFMDTQKLMNDALTRGHETSGRKDSIGLYF